MDLRLIELMIPRESGTRVRKILGERERIISWEEAPCSLGLRMRILLPAETTEAVTDVLEKEFKGDESFRLILIPVEATIPRFELPEKGKAPEPPPGGSKKEPASALRISRDELYGDISKTARLTWVFAVLVFLSTLVAAVGILRNNIVAIIGAMVIAPLLGPNVALALATTLGDKTLARRAIRTNLAGFLIALGLSAVLGRFLIFDSGLTEIFARTQVSLGDIILALAAGSAAALSFTSGLMSALIGVMVAVALLPPLVTLGLLAGSGQWASAYGALLLLLTNLICINLSGVAVFLLQGIRPLRWWEAEMAKRATQRAIIAWAAFLLILGILIVLAKTR
jgi:uncharacterized hydrophobic protein (TIGR00341 family)